MAHHAWLDLATADDSGAVDAALLGALELTARPGSSPIDAVVAHLRDRRGLLIVDNCEQVADAFGERSQQILQRCAEMRILATSRTPLGVAGEATWLVPPLSLEDLGDDGMNAALTLFTDRARTAVGGRAFTDEESAIAVEICRELEGVPLAIELAAAQLRVEGLREIHDRLADRLELLAGGPRLALPRHRTVRASIDWSYELLTAPEQALLMRVSVFSGGWDAEAMRAVCAGEAVDARELPALLHQLVLKSMVQPDSNGVATRYTLLDTVRQYAGERLEQRGETGVTRDRHLAYFNTVAARADRECWVVDPSRLATLDREAGNFAVALAHACSQHDPAALELVGPLAMYWREKGSLEGR